MGFIAKYPYTDFHELNLDYLLQVIKSVETTLRDFVSLNAIKYADPIQWSITRQYEKNTVVIDPLTGTAYISVAPVPIGAALTRPEYWTVIFDLEQFVTKASENFANTYEAQTTTTATQATPQYGWLVWGGILYVANTAITPGDAYVVDGNITRITVEDICGHIETLNTTDKSNLVAAVNEVLATLFSTAGDLNSLTTTDKSNLVAAINEVITTFDAAVLDIQTDMGDLATLATTDKSSLVNAINEVMSDLASAISTIDGVTGDLANLTTTDKTSLVNAINEVLSDLTSAVSIIDGVTGDLANLTTTDKTSLVNAINEVLSDLTTAISTIDGVTGDLANLTTTDKTSLVNAINETLDEANRLDVITTPEQYGAVGDGITDDTAAFTAALQSGAIVVLGNKTYKVSTLSITAQSLTVMGSGKYSIIECSEIDFTTCNDVTFRGLVIRGVDNTVSQLIKLSECYHVNFDGVAVAASGVTISVGILLDGFNYCYYNTFQNGRFNHFTTAVKLADSANSNTFIANEMYDNGTCVNIDSSNGNRFIGNAMQSFNLKAVEFNKNATGDPSGNTLIGNYFEPSNAATVVCDIDFNSESGADGNFIGGNNITYKNKPHIANEASGSVNTLLDFTSQSRNITGEIPFFVKRTPLTRAIVDQYKNTNCMGLLTPIDTSISGNAHMLYMGLVYDKNDNLAWAQFIHADGYDDRDVKWYSENLSDEMWLQPIRSGDTAHRPNYKTKGYMYFDETLGKPIWSNGGNKWYDATGAEV